MGKFRVSKEKLMAIAYACQDRNFSEDVDLLETLGGTEVLEEVLFTNFKDGLNGDEADFNERREAFGDNTKEAVEMKPFWELFIEALDDFTVKLLIVAATAALILELSLADSSKRATAWIDSFGIFMAVLVVGLVTAVNNYQKVIERSKDKARSCARSERNSLSSLVLISSTSLWEEV